MQRFHQILFVVSLVGLSWFAMMAIHEFGHVVGAMLSGGRVERVVLNPLTFSRTDVSPNPNPSVVVWLGPVLGCAIPVVVWLMVPRRLKHVRIMAMFVAGFCLIVNGAYIGGGAIEGVGDCAEMLRTGSPVWTLVGFGAITITLGLFVWHRLGSLKQFFADPSLVDARVAWLTFAVLSVVVVSEILLSPM